MPSLSLPTNVVWHTLGEIRENRSIDLGFWPCLMSDAVVEWVWRAFSIHQMFFECHLFRHPSFLSFYLSFDLSLSTSLPPLLISLPERSEDDYADTNEVVCWRLLWLLFLYFVVREEKSFFWSSKSNVSGLQAWKCAFLYLQCVVT